MSRIRAAKPVPQASPPPPHQARAATEKSQEMPKQAVEPAQSKRFSVTGSQAARLFDMAAEHSNVCPAVAIAPGVSSGIPQPQAEWYESAHLDGEKQADAANDGVSDTAVGNGWEYGDDDILGMVAPLNFGPHESVLDVGCGDGYFAERLLRLLPRLQVCSPTQWQ